MKKPCLLSFLILLLSGCASKLHEGLYEKTPAFYSYVIGGVHEPLPTQQWSERSYITPGSCEKAILATLYYRDLGPSFQFETFWYWANSGQDVVLAFSGDPTLKSEDLLSLLEPLQGKRIPGKILLDASHIQLPAYSPYWMITDMGVEQPVSALTIDENVVWVDILAKNEGEPAFVANVLEYPIQGQVLTTLDTTDIQVQWEGNSIKVSGTIASNSPLIKKPLTPLSAEEYALKKIKKIAEELNIKGTIVVERDVQKIPKPEGVVYRRVSPPLEEFLPLALKKSDNLVFDHLYAFFVNQYLDEAFLDWAQGDKVVKARLKANFSLDMDDGLFVDGSGLSRYNRVQTKKLFELLKLAYFDQKFVNALAFPGEMGSTLEKRVRLPITLRAKTGSLSGIRCLCGYNLSEQDPSVFVFYSTGFLPPASEVMDTRDQFLSEYFGGK